MQVCINSTIGNKAMSMDGCKYVSEMEICK